MLEKLQELMIDMEGAGGAGGGGGEGGGGEEGKGRGDQWAGPRRDPCVSSRPQRDPCLLHLLLLLLLILLLLLLLLQTCETKAC